jgi:hypothetical protein
MTCNPHHKLSIPKFDNENHEKFVSYEFVFLAIDIMSLKHIQCTYKHDEIFVIDLYKKSLHLVIIIGLGGGI